MTKITLIDQRVVKTGTTNNRKWTIYEYQGGDQKKYSSFDEFPIGIEVEVEVTEEEWKKKDGSVGGKNFRISRPKAPKANYNDPRFDALKARIDELEARLEGLEMSANATKVKEELPDDFPFKD